MHRSGTSMLTRMLEQLGLFMGDRKESNDEAVFFLGLNRWVMREAGGDWDHPAPVRLLVAEPDTRRLLAERFDALMHTPRVVRYTGRARWLRGRTPWGAGTAWGWKDPRNTFTLPVWMDVFPRARVLHIVRNGVDVASSLLVREQKSYSPERRRQRLPPLRGLNALWPRLERLRFAGSPRCRTLEGGFSLWEEYLDEARRHTAALGEQAMEVQYEAFVADPLPHLTRIAAFAGLDASPARLAEVAGQARPSRGDAWRGDAGLQAFAASVADRLAVAGYDESAAGSYA
jgi:hypothetical protein